MIKYPKIIAWGKDGTQDAIKGDITITEKLDGANASFGINQKGELECWSRNETLSETNNLQGFYQWVQTRIDATQLLPNVIYYGEWLVKHKIDYGKWHNDFYLFDIFSIDKNHFLTREELIFFSHKNNICLVPEFYSGEFISVEHIESFVGKSEIAPKGIGEGVVVKNTSYKNSFGNVVYVKFVAPEFKERIKLKEKRTATDLELFLQNTITKPRVEKFIFKLQDEGRLNQNLSTKDMSTILQTLGSSIVDDVLEEEMPELIKLVKKKAGSITPKIVLEILKEK